MADEFKDGLEVQQVALQPVASKEADPYSGLGRGIDVAGDLLGFKSADLAKDRNARQQGILRKLGDPNTVPSYLKFKQQADEYVDRVISVERKPEDTDETFQAAVQEKRNQYKSEVNQLLERTKQGWERNLVTRQHRIHSSFGTPPVRQERLKKYTVIELPITEDSGKAVDILQVLRPDGTDIGEVDGVVNEIRLMWSVFRDTNEFRDPQVVKLFIQDPESPSARAHAFMNKNPSILMEVRQQGFRDVAREEAIHAVFGAQAGHPASRDFAEGVANRIALAFNRSENFIHRHETRAEMALAQAVDWEKANPVGSHTQMLEEAGRQGIFVRFEEGDGPDHFSYLYGYVLCDAILKSPLYRQYSDRARSEGRNPYGLLLKMNRDLSIESLEREGLAKKEGNTARVALNNRQLMAQVLKRNGFDPQEVFGQVNKTMTFLKNGGKIS